MPGRKFFFLSFCTRTKVKERVQPEATAAISSYEGLTRQVLGPQGQALTGLIIFVELYGVR